MPSLVDREQQALFQTYNRLPLVPERAEGSCIYGANNKRYLDCVSGLGAMALGHSHPKVLSAVQQQTHRYMHLSNLFVQEPQIALAESLIAVSGLERVFFCNSGTEAIEGAVKLVRRFKRNSPGHIVAFEGGFHGRTLAALSMMNKPLYKDNMGPFGEGFVVVDENDTDTVKNALEGASAVFFEPVKGEGGIRLLNSAVVPLIQQAQSRGTLVVCDEIQSGLGRTGAFFAFEHLDIMPDIVTIAKAIGGGLPLGAILAREVVAQAFEKGHHGTTFGGNAVACAAGQVVIQELQSGLLEAVREKSTYFLAELQKSLQDVQVVESIRIYGLMIGIQLNESAGQYVERLLHEHNIIANATSGTVIRLLPPLIITPAELQEVATALHAVLSNT